MNGSALHKTAADCAEGLPGAQLEHPFGPAWEVYKVRGKVFMLMTEVPGRPVVILKAGYSQDKPETRSWRCSPCSTGVQVIEPSDPPRSRHALQRRLVL
jgi:hypothetical protein